MLAGNEEGRRMKRMRLVLRKMVEASVSNVHPSAFREAFAALAERKPGLVDDLGEQTKANIKRAVEVRATAFTPAPAGMPPHFGRRSRVPARRTDARTRPPVQAEVEGLFMERSMREKLNRLDELETQQPALVASGLRW